MEYYKNLSLEDLFYIDDDGLVCCEEWRDVPNYIGLYQASNLGRIKSLERFVRNRNNIMKVQNKVLKSAINTNGYRTVVLRKDLKGKSIAVHRLVAIAFILNINKKKCVNHKNGIKIDNSISNLEWCTSSENNKHAFDNGLRKSLKGTIRKTFKGENCSFSQLTEKNVLEIRKIGRLMKQKDIGSIYNVTEDCIGAVLRKETWKHI